MTRLGAALGLAVVLLAARAWASEVVDEEGGYRLEVPATWQSVEKGDRVVLIDPDGVDKKGALVRGGARIWVRPIDDVNRWFEELLNRDESRDVHRRPQGEDGVASFEYIDSLSRRDIDLRVTIQCRRIGARSICVVLEFRTDDPQPAMHRKTHARVIESLRPAK